MDQSLTIHVGLISLTVIWGFAEVFPQMFYVHDCLSFPLFTCAVNACISCHTAAAAVIIVSPH